MRGLALDPARTHPDVSCVPVAKGEAESDPVDDDQPATALSVAA